MLARRSTFWAVALLSAVLAAMTNLPWHLDDYDQAKQAFTSFEMVHAGQWLYQHTPNERVATKPPLVGWVSAALYSVSRSWELAWRLPSAAAAVALAWALTRSAGAAYGRVAAVVALGAFALNLLTPRLATLVRTDMPLALVIALLGVQIWRKIRTGETWSSRDRLVTFALLTAAMLVKGPIVLAMLLPGIVLFQLRRRMTGESASAWPGWWPWLASLAVFGVWVAGGIYFLAGFYEQVVLKEFAGRFGDTVHRPQPFYFYVPHLLHKFAPWSLLIIGCAVLAARGESLSVWERLRRISPDVFWLLCWSVGALLLMSLIPSKRVDRIYPIVPPLCLLLAAQVRACPHRWVGAAFVFACVFTTGYAAQRVFISYRNDEAALVRFGREVRNAAAANNWRYEVIGGREEGLLLYLQRLRFISPEQALERWRHGSLDALVVPADEIPPLAQTLHAGIEATVRINGRDCRYVLLKQAK
jgi:4-amino-4-deoxy-L-arabinose transferase-like glycosyltransferase